MINNTVIEGPQSNIEVSVLCTQDDINNYKQKTLKYFQQDMDIKGFRKGHVPLSMVEENINPQYLMVALYGEIVDQSLKQILKEKSEYKLIGEPSDIQHHIQEDTVTVSYKIDTYPRVVINSEARKSLKPAVFDDTVVEQDIEQAIQQMCREHSEYQPVDISTTETVCRLKLMYLDETGAQIDQGVGFRGPEDMTEYPLLQNKFVGLKIGDSIQIEYDQSSLPKFFLSSKKDLEPTTLRIEITMISQQMIPEFTDENIKKRFSDASTIEQIKLEMEKQIKNYKHSSELVQSIDAYISQCQQYMTVALPKTIIDAEIKSRKDALIKKIGGEANYDKYIDQLDDAKKNEMNNEIESSAKTSLEKYFIMDMILEQHHIHQEDFKNHHNETALEQALYDVLVTTPQDS